MKKVNLKYQMSHPVKNIAFFMTAGWGIFILGGGSQWETFYF